MFKKLLLTFCFILIFPLTSYASTNNISIFTLNQTNYTVNGLNGTMDSPPILINSNVYLPLRYIAYSCGITDDGINWNNDNQSVQLTLGEITVSLQVGQNILVKNGSISNIDVAPIIENGHVYIPAKIVCENFGYSVSWDENKQQVSISPNTSAEQEQIKQIIQNLFNAANNKDAAKYDSYLDQNVFNKDNQGIAQMKSTFTNYDLNFDVSNIQITSISNNKAKVQYTIITKANKIIGNNNFQDRIGEVECTLEKINNKWQIEDFNTISIKYLN